MRPLPHLVIFDPELSSQYWRIYSSSATFGCIYIISCSNISFDILHKGVIVPRSNKRYSTPPKRYRKGVVPDSFMTSEEILKTHQNIITELLDAKLQQEDLDELYDRIVDMYYSEMDKFLKEIKKAPASGKKVRHTKKPYWTEELSALWKEYHTCEKEYLSTPEGSLNLTNSRDRFRTAQSRFNKTLKKARRAFQRQQVYNLEECNTADPIEFWNSIARMGPKRRTGIPWEVVNEEGETVTDKKQVLQRWMSDFCGLLTPPSV